MKFRTQHLTILIAAFVLAAAALPATAAFRAEYTFTGDIVAADLGNSPVAGEMSYDQTYIDDNSALFTFLGTADDGGDLSFEISLFGGGYTEQDILPGTLNFLFVSGEVQDLEFVLRDVYVSNPASDRFAGQPIWADILLTFELDDPALESFTQEGDEEEPLLLASQSEGDDFVYELPKARLTSHKVENFTIVPEPSSLLMALGCVSLLAARRRRRAA